MILKLSLDLPGDGAYVPVTRHFGRVLLEHLKVVRQDIGDVDTIVTELVSNVVRHAQASQVRVELAHGHGRLHLIVRDNGVGFDLDSARRQLNRGTSMGLLGMEERVGYLDGRLAVESAPGRGTLLRVTLPLAGKQPA